MKLERVDMTLDGIRARHVRVFGNTWEPDYEHPEASAGPPRHIRRTQFCDAERVPWPCEVARLLAVLDAANGASGLAANAGRATEADDE